METQISQVSTMLAFCNDLKKDSCTFIALKTQPNPTFSIKNRKNDKNKLKEWIGFVVYQEKRIWHSQHHPSFAI